MWPGLFLTMWSQSSPPFNTCVSSPKFEQSFCVRSARLRTSRWHSPIWWSYTKPATSDRDIPQCRSPNWWHSRSSVFWGWWLGPPCSGCYTATMATLLCYWGHDPRSNNTQQYLQTKTYCTWCQCQHPDQLYQFIADMEKMDRLGCRREESSMNIEGKATPFWYRNPIAAIQYILGHLPFKHQLLYAPVKQMNCNGEGIFAEMWTADWWWKTQASFHVLSERACQRECVRERQSQIVRESMSESLSESLSESIRVRLSEIACQGFIVSEQVVCQECQCQCWQDFCRY